MVDRLLNAVSYFPLISVVAVAMGAMALITSFFAVQGAALTPILVGIGLAIVASFSLLLVSRRPEEVRHKIRLKETLGIEDRVTASLERRQGLEEKFEGTVAEALSKAGFDVARDMEARVSLKSFGVREPLSRYRFDLVVFVGGKTIPIEIKARPIEPSDVLSVSMRAKEWMTVVRNLTIPIIVTTGPISRISLSASQDKVRLIGNGSVSQLVQLLSEFRN
ncbi:MAG: hypothetical protein ABSG74_07995 [Candidatus Bathyarchaeia archaeon]|jgi:hypothetical protein